MKKYRCMLGDRFIDVEADSEEAAQEQAFARAIRDLRPQDIIAWETGSHDDGADTVPADAPRV